MAKKSKKSVVWIWRDHDSDYCIGCRRKPYWTGRYWKGDHEKYFCSSFFERLFPFFKMPPLSLGKIINDGDDLTFEIVETR